MKNGLRGCTLQRVLLRRSSEGYLDVYLDVGDEVFELLHNSARRLESLPKAEDSTPNGFRGRRISSVWTDEETLVILLEPPSAIKFGFGVPGVDANREALDYVDSKHEMTALLKSLEDEEFERIEAQ